MAETRIDNANGQRIAIIGLPFDANSSFLRGAAAAPPLIREALYSDAGHMWTESGLDLRAGSVLMDAGDIEDRAGEDMNSRIELGISNLLERDLLPISLGGDHAVTVPIVRALATRYPHLSLRFRVAITKMGKKV